MINCQKQQNCFSWETNMELRFIKILDKRKKKNRNGSLCVCACMCVDVIIPGLIILSKHTHIDVNGTVDHFDFAFCDRSDISSIRNAPANSYILWNCYNDRGFTSAFLESVVATRGTRLIFLSMIISPRVARAFLRQSEPISNFPSDIHGTLYIFTNFAVAKWQMEPLVSSPIFLPLGTFGKITQNYGNFFYCSTWRP